MLAWLGLITILFSWAAAAYLLHRWRHLGVKSISEHGAGDPRAYAIFATSLTLCAFALYAWLGLWLAPKLGLESEFQLMLAITAAAMVISAIVPDIQGRRRVHRLAAYIMALSFIPLAVLITTAPHISFFAQVAGILITAYMVITFTAVVILRIFWHRFLIFQILYILAMQLLLLIAAYA